MIGTVCYNLQQYCDFAPNGDAWYLKWNLGPEFNDALNRPTYKSVVIFLTLVWALFHHKIIHFSVDTVCNFLANLGLTRPRVSPLFLTRLHETRMFYPYVSQSSNITYQLLVWYLKYVVFLTYPDKQVILFSILIKLSWSQSPCIKKHLINNFGLLVT